MVGLSTLVAGKSSRMLLLLDVEQAIGGADFTAGASKTGTGW